MEDEQPRQGLNPRTMRKVTVSLIGEQPIPNLLPLRHQPPDVAVLVHTGRTENVARRLQRLLQPIEVHLLPTDPYDVQRIQEDLSNFLAQRAAGAEFEFNLTGGTKTMMVAAYEIARKYNAPFLYLQSEGKRSILYRYRFDNGEPRYEGKESLPSVITIDDYLKAHLDNYPIDAPKRLKDDLGKAFEEEIARALEGTVDEVKVGIPLAGALEVDLVVRKENQVGVIQAKTGKKAGSKEGLDQLNSVCEQRYLGTYTHKILVVNQKWDQTRSNLRELAQAWRITVIELPSFNEQHPHLSEEDRQRLRQEVLRVLTGS